jgi:exosortase
MEKQSANGVLEDFRIEFLECWRRMPNKGFFLVLLVAWLALFHFLGNATLGYIKTPSLLGWMNATYQPSTDAGANDDSHGRYIPLVVLGLFWWKRKQLMALPMRAWWPALLLLGLALVLHVLGYMVQQPKVSIVALFAGIYALMGLAWGREWLRESFFPFILFAFCIPLGWSGVSLTFPLRLLVVRIVEIVCHFVLAIDIRVDGTAIMDPTGRYQYEVAAACSGLRSLIATLAVAVIYAMVSFRSWWRRGVLIGSALPLAVFGNVVRMLTIVVAAEIGGQEWGSRIHEGGPMGIYSLLPYIPAFAGLMFLGHLLQEPSGAVVPAPPGTREQPSPSQGRPPAEGGARPAELTR